MPTLSIETRYTDGKHFCVAAFINRTNIFSASLFLPDVVFMQEAVAREIRAEGQALAQLTDLEIIAFANRSCAWSWP